ncbi:MAG: hypothetical protein DHS20C18_19320 [Saprospiraceae bacterium]|nr:MAG: hypothetical protein DHS20C18_19320 [Saprospiraceae bacterium]
MGQKISDSNRQRMSIRKLEGQGFISDVVSYDNPFAKLEWMFSFGEIVFHHDENSTPLDFSKYKVRVIYRPNKKGNKKVKVFIDKPALTKRKHLWEDGSLCLWKGTKFQWEKGMSIKNDLFPSICTWIYHYEKWLETGIWHGEEAEH